MPKCACILMNFLAEAMSLIEDLSQYTVTDRATEFTRRLKALKDKIEEERERSR